MCVCGGGGGGGGGGGTGTWLLYMYLFKPLFRVPCIQIRKSQKLSRLPVAFLVNETLLMDDGWITFNSIIVISGRLADDNERLCARETRLRLRRFRLERGKFEERYSP